MPDKKNNNKDNLVDDSTVEADELVDVDDLQSVLTRNDDDEIGSSERKNKDHFNCSLKKGKKEGFILMQN
jgi:hypothetical protein